MATIRITGLEVLAANFDTLLRSAVEKSVREVADGVYAHSFAFNATTRETFNRDVIDGEFTVLPLEQETPKLLAEKTD